MAKHTLYINTQYHNEVTLDCPMDTLVDGPFEITWYTLIHEILGEDEKTFFDDIELDNVDLNDEIDSHFFERYSNNIYYWIDNDSGGQAQAFKLIRSLSSFSTDKDGNGQHHGVSTSQTTCNGPKKYVYVEGVKAADWLRQALQKDSLDVDIEFI